MKYKIDHDFHIHSHLSVCSGDMRQTTENILAYGVANGYKEICLTDHFWDKTIQTEEWDWGFYNTQDVSHIEKSLPLPQVNGTTFYFGGETDVAAGNVLGCSPETIEKLDFLIISTTHFNFSQTGVQPDATATERAKAWLERFHAVLDMDLPFHKIGIAHLTCELIIPSGAIENVFILISDEELEKVFTKAAKVRVGIEINAFCFDFAAWPQERIEQTLRVFSAAKKCGCKFYLASDGHNPEELQKGRPNFEIAIESLGLTEDDKFHPFKENK